MIDISNLNNKTHNKGADESGRLAASEWNTLVSAVEELQGSASESISYEEQELTEEQKAQVRANIGAGTYSKPSNGIPASDIADGVIPDVSGKQDTIADLSTIRSGAAAGATAYQKPQSGIPATDLSSAAQTSLGKADTAYQKPGAGIPKTDFDSTVRHTLDLADDAVQATSIGVLTPVNPGIYATVEEVQELNSKISDISTGKYYGYYATTSDLPDDATADGFAYVGGGPTYTIYNCVGGEWTSSALTVNQSPVGNDDDIDQDSNGKLRFADRAYNSQNPNGMGYKILRKDATFASQVTETNTIYEIRYAFTVDSALTIPAGCALFLNGGKISGAGTLTFQDTKVYGNGCIVCDIAGTIEGEANIDNFGAVNGYDAGSVINKVAAVSKHVVIPGDYQFTTPVIVSGAKTIEWPGTLRYIGNETDIDVFTIKSGSGALNMSGALYCEGSNLSYSTPTNIRGLVFENKNSYQVNIGIVCYFNVNVVVIGKGSGCAYNTFNLGRIMHGNIGMLLTQDNDGSDAGFVNENLFLGGRFANFSNWPTGIVSNAIVAKKVYDTDTYAQVNSLSFIKTSVEGYGTNPAFIFENANGVTISECRTEGTNTCAKLVGNCKNINISSLYGTSAIDYEELSSSQSAGAFMSDVNTYKSEIFDLDKREQGEKVGTKYYPFSLMPMSVSGGTEHYGTYNSTINTVTKIGVEINFSNNNWNPVTVVLNNSDGSRKNIYVTLKAELDGTSIPAANQQNFKVKFLGTTMSYNSSNYWASGANVNRQTILFPPGVGRVRIMMDNWQVATVIVPQNAWITHRKTLIRTGATADRPNQNFCFPGLTFFDTTLGKEIVNNGTTWVNMDGTALS